MVKEKPKGIEVMNENSITVRLTSSKMDNKSTKVKNNKSTSSELIDGIFKHLAQINGEINRMNTNELIERLKYYSLDTGGNDDIKRRRLKNNYKRIKLASVNVNISNNLLPYYVIIDFEATCLESYLPGFEHEIIEFPAVLINSSTGEVEDTFQMYCKPVINPKLTDFCVELTGITQEQVDSANDFTHVLQCFENWLKSHRLGKKHKFGIVTDSPWDMSRYLFQQCHYSGVPFPNWARRWINLKRSFFKFYKCEKMVLKDMLNYLDMEFEGRLHCGLDDAKNIARILVRMIKDGANIQPNEKITKHPPPSREKYLRKGVSTEQKGCAPENDTEKNELIQKMENLRVQAYFTVIKNKDQLSTYEKVKRQRGILEAKIKRELKGKFENLENGDDMRDILEPEPSPEIRENKRVKIKWKKFDLSS